ncbi:MAG: transcription antitermination factor NusB [Myxococcota bacterium]|nr:transcription antitermination factor NusB [Myxococcota bacterium]
MSAARRAPRQRSRQAALQVLYALDLRRAAGDPEKVEEAFDTVTRHFELPEGAREFAEELVNGVSEHRGAIDTLLAEHATNWRVERMAAVDRNVLRLAAYEMLHGGTPANVAIDEAVELARRFGGDRSPGFVNGVLDAVARTLTGLGTEGAKS